ncbi:hypothetical protein [Lichenicola sp.]|uniref:hypothetical protein n=1 Tax=Lichenicola sp. TaxID=2804529 RepID=UPI003AFFFB0F
MDFATTAAPATVPDRAALYAIRLLFDRDFYLSRNQDVARCGIDPLDHFLTAGLAEGRSPCALFDPEFYLLQQAAPPDREFLFLHYLTVGIRAGLDPHPLVETGFYIAQSPPLPPHTNPLTHMLGAGRREHRRPNRLFDPAYYRRRQQRSEQTLHPLIHYVLRGWQEKLQPHPLFDVATYLETRPDIEAAGVDPLAHYLRHGHREQTRTHWLFDPEHYAASSGDGILLQDALLHCAVNDCGLERSPHPLFDARHYLRQHPDLADSGIDPFLHFLEFGLHENRDPHPLFDTWFYRSQNPDVVESGTTPFEHYIRHGITEGRDPNPFFPAPIYQVRNPAVRGESAGPLAHFLRTPATHLSPLCMEFDAAYYMACHPTCAIAARAGVPPLSHYLAAGRAARLSPRPVPIDRHPWIGPLDPGRLQLSDPTGQEDAAARTSVLLIVQEASHTEACISALRALHCLVTDPELQCRVVIRRDGPLTSAFAGLASTIILSGASGGSADTDLLVEILYSFRDLPSPRIVILNSAGMPETAAVAKSLGLELIAWLHEPPLLIDSLLGGDASMRILAAAASRIVTSSTAAREALVGRYKLQNKHVVVLVDGVPEPAALDTREARLALRRQMGLPPDALIVLGSGSVGFRDGTDLFIRVASRVIAHGADQGPPASALQQAFFLWIGAAEDPLFALLCQTDIDRLGLSDRIRLLGLQPDAADLIAAADLFLLTSREDVTGTGGIQAQLAGLTIVGFRGCTAGLLETATASGKATARPRLLEVDYLDLEAMSAAVIACGNRPARRARSAPLDQTHRPSWEHWHQGLRGLLANMLTVPVTTAVVVPSQARATRRGKSAAREAAPLGHALAP